MTTSGEDRVKVSGRVLWYDPNKGFGFITSEQVEDDILLPKNVLLSFNRSSVADGSAIEAMIYRTPQGWSAETILGISLPPDMVVPHTGIYGLTVADIEKLPMLPVRVKWYDPQKGIGFVNVCGQSQDVFVHADIVRRSGFTTLMGGEAILVKVIDGRRGKMAVQVLPWEAACQATVNGRD